MSTNTPVTETPKWMLLAGWTIGLLPVLMLLMSGAMKLAKPAVALGGVEEAGRGVGELGGPVIYLIPQTAVFGAILLTGYLGGAVATHVRVGDAFVIPIV